MPISDIFTTPFLICLGICLLLLGLLGMYFTQKIMEQNHKISSMLGLVTTMAEELNFLRSRFQMNTSNLVQQASGAKNATNQVPEEEPLIEVSDDEEDDEEEDDDSVDDDDSEEEEEEKLVIGEEDPSTIKVIQMGETMVFREKEEEEQEQELEELEELEESTFVTDEDNASLAEESVSASVASVVSATSETSETSSAKKVSGANLKKMTIQNLRDIAVKKGFSGDVSKMKKADIVKIVEGLL
jgi:hypothetical protein